MIRQDLVRGVGLALFDPHGDLAERVVAWLPKERQRDLIYLDVPDPAQPFGFNPLSGVPLQRRSVVANGVVEALKKIFAESWGVRLEYILRAALLLLLDQPTATIADVLRLFHEPEFRLAAAEKATNEQVKRFWTADFEKYGRLKAEAISPIENKLGAFLIDPFVSRILTSAESSFDPRKVMDEGRVLIVNLAKGKIGEAPAMLFGSLLVSALAMAGLSRADAPEAKRRDFVIYMDEFQTFTTLALTSMLAELRKYSVPLVLGNQFLEQLSPEIRSAILGNVGTLIVFRVGASDATRLAKELGPNVLADDLTFLENRNFWMRPLVKGKVWPAFTGETIAIDERPVGD
jgi:type IV secretory pathway TraG/TraD family ATPase VirD4